MVGEGWDWSWDGNNDGRVNRIKAKRIKIKSQESRNEREEEEIFISFQESLLICHTSNLHTDECFLGYWEILFISFSEISCDMKSSGTEYQLLNYFLDYNMTRWRISYMHLEATSALKISLHRFQFRFFNRKNGRILFGRKWCATPT